ncbi:hypothetical protein C9374_008657 [Naegleria lovaniensis]|uniref:Phosphoribulokinase/uridine kinase domain-containing protein n=1 Tax=Naegleria lovaniensis TaxID=51637 RepID=A0AA88GJN4_NAELO|nr:uncharacterized protein C9374_008657 [Naegleria lovaniensis]KAG2378035.1 hypothetical protein C9374_008657 [Naegleria lovaniensis]
MGNTSALSTSAAVEVCIVNINGATCSGKSTLAEYLCQRFNSPIGPIGQDHFITNNIPIFKKHILHDDQNVQLSDTKSMFREWPNYECEQSINFVRFEQVIKTAREIILSQHHDLEQMKRQFMELGYTFWNENFDPSQTLMISNKKVYLIVVEGFLSCCSFNLMCNLFDINIYLNASKDLCLKRRSWRDQNKELSQVSKEFISWFNELVWPFHQLYRTRQLSNIIKSGRPFLCLNSKDDIEELQGTNEEKLIDKVSSFINDLLMNRGESLSLMHHELPDWFDLNTNYEESEKELEQFLFSHHIK